MELKHLKDFFPLKDIEFLPIKTSDTSGLAVPYISNRAIQNRLDEVCGLENWKNEFIEWKDKNQLCGISIRFNDEWVTKWDGAEDTNVEAVKGGLSGSMKRAAVQWGIGRYLYDIPPIYVDIYMQGKYVKFKNPKSITLPKEFLPQGDKSTVNIEINPLDIIADKFMPSDEVIISQKEIDKLDEWVTKYEVNSDTLLNTYNVTSYGELTKRNYQEIIGIFKKRNKGFMLDNQDFFSSLE